MIEMTETQRRKFRQRIQGASDTEFWDALTILFNRAYDVGVNQTLETAWMHPRISKTMTDWVCAKLEDTRSYSGAEYVDIADSVLELITGNICAECKRKIT